MWKLLHSVWLPIVVAIGIAYGQSSVEGQAGGDASAQLVGSRRVLSYEFEFQDGGERVRPLGTRPRGFVIFGPDGRMMAYLEASDRTPPRNDQERAEAYKTINAYTGRYRVEGSQWITMVDGAWNVEWAGAEQARAFTLVGDRLTVTGQWNVNPLYGGRVARGRLTFERER
jgi:hypothetical protein